MRFFSRGPAVVKPERPAAKPIAREEVTPVMVQAILDEREVMSTWVRLAQERPAGGHALSGSLVAKELTR